MLDRLTFAVAVLDAGGRLVFAGARRRDQDGDEAVSAKRSFQGRLAIAGLAA